MSEPLWVLRLYNSRIAPDIFDFFSKEKRIFHYFTYFIVITRTLTWIVIL